MFDENTLKALNESGGVFKFGSGLMGKSAIVICVLEAGLFGVALTIHSDLMKFGAIVLGVLIFCFWLIRIIGFADKHPDKVLLEGAEWSAYKRFEATAKNFSPKPEDLQPALPGAAALVQSPALSTKVQEQERHIDG
ncbi:MAG TPA: hypothetical protein VND90_02205 [Terracidiphilus sp.]|nr:hypothetical protein [Terracidiphilus sp.]